MIAIASSRPTDPAVPCGGVTSGENPVLLRLQEIESLVDRLVASWHGPGVLPMRRWHRIAYQKPIAVTPLDDRLGTPIAPAVLATGRDISPRGLSFTHFGLLPYRMVAVTFPLKAGDCESVAVRLSWCRFTTAGLYFSGGKFVRGIALPAAAELDWTALPPA